MTVSPSRRFTCYWGNTTRRRRRQTRLPVRLPTERSFLRDHSLLKRSDAHSSYFVSHCVALTTQTVCCMNWYLCFSWPDLSFFISAICSYCTLQLTCFLQPRSCAQCSSNLCSSPTGTGTSPFCSSGPRWSSCWVITRFIAEYNLILISNSAHHFLNIQKKTIILNIVGLCVHYGFWRRV